MAVFGKERNVSIDMNGPAYGSASSNTVLNATGKHHAWSGKGGLSVKSFTNGTAQYEIDNHPVEVDERSYLILNYGQEYTVSIDSPSTVRAFCVFFRDGFAEEVYASGNSSATRLLDDPTRQSSRLEFFPTSRPHDRVLSPALSRFRAAYSLRSEELGWVEEQTHKVMVGLLYAHHQILKEVDTVKVVRASTRTELYRRIHMARDYICSSLSETISLDVMARVACLSTSHFLQTFREIVGKSPHQYLVVKRLERAAELMKSTDRTVTEIAFEVGFESLGSFYWLFRRRYGLSPKLYRRTKR